MAQTKPCGLDSTNVSKLWKLNKSFKMPTVFSREETQVNIQAPSVPRQLRKHIFWGGHVLVIFCPSWCSYCVSCTSNIDSFHRVRPQPERRQYPVIQTKMLTAFLVGTKDTNHRGQTEHINHLSLMLNYVDKIEIVADSEPSILDLLRRIDFLLR